MENQQNLVEFSQLSKEKQQQYQQAADAIRQADAFFFTAGAGMGVDSGLPDFRGNEGFWNAYPPLKAKNLSLAEMANPTWFEDDPAFAWGFYGHRLNLYRRTQPHDGFQVLRRFARHNYNNPDVQIPHFVYTSNVDGHFQKAGFDENHVCEVHGSINYQQCMRHCTRYESGGIFPALPAAPAELVVDMDTLRAQHPLPTCPHCHSLARPNILMFGDAEWEERRSWEQEKRLFTWIDTLKQTTPKAKLVVIECGAGTAIPTVRRLSESIASQLTGTLIRLNKRDFHGPEYFRNLQFFGLDVGAKQGLLWLEQLAHRS